MPETIIESVLSGKIDAALLLKWLNCDTREDTPEDCALLCCNRSEFVAHFLSYLRNQTDSILRSNSNAIQLLQHQSTPEKILNSRRKHRRSISDPTSDDRNTDSLSVKIDRQRSHESPSKDKKRGRRVKTKLFTEEKPKDQSISSDESRLSIGLERVVISSTPLKNGQNYPNLPLTSPVTPNRSFKEYERCDTPRLNQRHLRSHEKSCLGDYLVNAQKGSKKKKGKNTSNDDSDVKIELDLSNSEQFPQIGVRKSSSLRSDRKRIKPTNIDRSTSQKSFSLNSFTSECFQQPSPLALEDNIAFKAQNVQSNEVANSFEAERNILKQERHKLMEKFNILNTSASPKNINTPQIKVIQNNSIEKISYIKSDATKVVLKDKIDILVDIYDVLIKKDLILSVITEIYFLISIILSKQSEIDYEEAESNLKDNHLDYLLKSIHNSTYFAVKSLWNQRLILEVILDKNSLKILGENKRIRSFYPDLAKFLLNSYGLKCEAESSQDKKVNQELRPSNGVICFNLETDNVDNFPSALSFQSFKKQRDMFYEILRWYQETQSSGGSRATFRARIKPLLSAATSAANHTHLAALFTRHMLAALPHNTQESKLSKLQRRLTCPSATESHRLPHFSEQEMFYKEFVMNTDNESFRVHLRDKLSSEIIALDCTPFAEDRNNAHLDLPREYLALSNKLQALSKLLGYLYALPYCINAEAGAGRMATKQSYATPKDKVLENDLALRNYSQPSIDLIGLLTNARKLSRLCVTLPWIIHFLSMLDYTSLRIQYYQKLIKTIFDIYSYLKHETKYKKNTLIFLKSILGWLFDLPHFPIEFYYEKTDCDRFDTEVNIDCYNIIDESVLMELCPYLRDVNVLLSTCRVGQEQKESFRHITPVSLSLNPEDRMRNKEKELQNRLEEELLKSQPASTRRVLELVCERVTSLCVRHLSSTMLANAREHAREQAAALVRANEGDSNLLQSLQALYANHVQQLCASALQSAEVLVRSRAAAALGALLPHAPPPILKLAVRGCLNRLAKWLHDNWRTTAILCKDIEAEMKNLLVLGDSAAPCGAPRPDPGLLTAPHAQFDSNNVSPAAAIIQLKEQICLLLEYSEPANLSRTLSTAANACSAHNVFARAPSSRALLRLTEELCLVFVSRKPTEVNETFLNQFHNIWNTYCPDRRKNQTQDFNPLPERREDLSPDFRNYPDDERAPTPVSDDENQKNPVIELKNAPNEFSGEQTEFGSEQSVVNSERSEINSSIEANDSKISVENSAVVFDDNNSEFLEFFDRILCPRNIVLLSSSKCKQSEVWESLATVLVFLLKNDYLSEDSLTEQCLAVYRQDWPQNILESLSTCMKSVSSRWSRSSAGKFTLFLDFLAEYCGDLDYEPME